MGLKVFDKLDFKFADEWAVDNVVIPDRGPYTFDFTPYFELPTRCASDLNHYCRVVIMSPAQVGKTSFMLNVIGWMCSYDPSNTLFIMDQATTYQTLSNNRIKPFLRDQVKLPSMQGGIGSKRYNSSVKNISIDSNHNLVMGSSKSASDLCSFPAKYVLMDELDRFERSLKNEGDPILLALKRQLTYRGMCIMSSTPTDERGPISQHYKAGTQRVWGVRCECGNFCEVNFRDIDFGGDVPFWVCSFCGLVYDEVGVRGLEHLYSEPNNSSPYVDKYGRVCESFRLSAPLVHNYYTWDSIKREEQVALSLSVDSYRSFVNTTLGEAYIETSGVSLSVSGLMSIRRYIGPDSLPIWCRYVTVGVDVQGDRFEAVVVCFSEDGGNVLVFEHKRIYDESGKRNWRLLVDWLRDYYLMTVDGRRLVPNVVCIDSGFASQEVYAFCMEMGLVRFYPVKGVSGSSTVSGHIYKTNRVSVNPLGAGVQGSVYVTLVNTYYGKSRIRDNLLSLQGASTLFKSKWVFTSYESSHIDENFFEQLDSEYLEVVGDKRKWRKKVGVRNEALDCLDYALTGYELIQLRLGKLLPCGEDLRGLRGEDLQNSGVEEGKISKDSIGPKYVGSLKRVL